MPILRLDDRSWALKGTQQFTDQRVRYFWDGAGLTGKAWQEQLGLPGVAWDVYFLYTAQDRWQGKPSKPAYWSHQSNAMREQAPWFDRGQLEKKTNELLALIHN